MISDIERQMRVTVDGAAIDVAADGKGEANVLIHGFPLARDIWDPQAEKLAERGITALSIAPAGTSPKVSMRDAATLLETAAKSAAAGALATFD